MAKRKKKKNGRYIFGTVCVVAAVGIALGLNFDGLGFGDGWGFGTSNGSNDSNYDANGDNGANGTINDDDSDENGQEGNNGDTMTHLIIVEGDAIMHDGAEISLEQLSTLLATYPDAIWELRSERAIAAVQDDVRTMLQQHDVSFTETTD